ncbi:MAG: hypothetical protein DI623_07565 [Sphingomonas sanxanigenens]|uniref:Uncharacterized protein n=1 Tax=Sphingomonas sanxanigenens TaxID=397260 RepID=A0A2W5A716_9SPHN|nr:MAG: hypothetical protein DI623_07565 [Sphingomonas sanxanigenens]
MAGRRHLLSEADPSALPKANRHRRGLAQRLTVFLIRGFLSLFFHLLRAASPGQIGLLRAHLDRPHDLPERQFARAAKQRLRRAA